MSAAPPNAPPNAAATVTAWPHEGIVPLELSDVLIEGTTLVGRREDPTFYASLAAAVVALRNGDAVRDSGDRVPPRPWTVVSLVGGVLDEARARDAFDAAGIMLDVVSDDAFFAASHALEALGENGALRADAVVIDVGRSAIKAAGPGGRISRRRVCPAVHGDEPSAELRAAFAAEIAAALVDACPGRPPSFVLLGMAGGGIPLVRDVLDRAACSESPAAIVNDAVLAAWALARRSPCRSPYQLVLTVGLGVGAALIDRQAVDLADGR